VHQIHKKADLYIYTFRFNEEDVYYIIFVVYQQRFFTFSETVAHIYHAVFTVEKCCHIYTLGWLLNMQIQDQSRALFTIQKKIKNFWPKVSVLEEKTIKIEKNIY